MAVAVGVFSEARQRTLRAVCDTIAPSLESDSDDPVLRAFFARSASDMDVPGQIEELLAQTALPEEIEALGQLLDGFAAQDFARWGSRRAPSSSMRSPRPARRPSSASASCAR